jgi:hypothetical protein
LPTLNDEEAENFTGATKMEKPDPFLEMLTTGPDSSMPISTIAVPFFLSDLNAP